MPCEKDIELHERVAKVEERCLHIDGIVTGRASQLNRIESRIDSMEKDLERYRGSVGAILLVGTAVATFFKLFWGNIKAFFG